MTGDVERLGSYPTEEHVLRNAFLPNKPLQQGLSQLVLPGSNWARHFGIFGGDQLVVKSDWSTRLELGRQRRLADAALSKETNTPIRIDSMDAQVIRLRGRAALLLSMKLQEEDVPTYERVISGSLDLIKMGSRGYAVGAEPTLYVTPIPTEELGIDSASEVHEAQMRLQKFGRSIKEKAGQHYYELTPSPHLVGITLPQATQDSSEAALPEASAS